MISRPFARKSAFRCARKVYMLSERNFWANHLLGGRSNYNSYKITSPRTCSVTSTCRVVSLQSRARTKGLESPWLRRDGWRSTSYDVPSIFPRTHGIFGLPSDYQQQDWVLFSSDAKGSAERWAASWYIFLLALSGFCWITGNAE